MNGLRRTLAHPSVLSVHTDAFWGAWKWTCCSVSRPTSPRTRRLSRRIGCRRTENVDPPDQPTRAFRDRRYAAGATGSPRPSKRKAILMAKVQDEAGHGPASTAPVKCSACSGTTPLPTSTAARRSTAAFQLPHPELGGHRRHRLAVDGAAIMNQVPCKCSYGPYARAMVRVCKEESFHQRQGFQIMMTMAGEDQKAMAQDALNRWWWPSLMMFGPPDDDSPNSAQSMAWNIKRFSNDELREVCGPHCPPGRIAGTDRPDPDLNWNEETDTTTSARSIGRIQARGLRPRPLQQGTHRDTPDRLGQWRVGSGRRQRPCEKRCPPRCGRHRRRLTSSPWTRRTGPSGKSSSAAVRDCPTAMGSLHAADAEMAVENARDVYTRRQEGAASGWCPPMPSPPPRPTKRTCCLTQPTTRCTATRPSTTSPTRSST